MAPHFLTTTLTTLLLATATTTTLADPIPQGQGTAPGTGSGPQQATFERAWAAPIDVFQCTRPGVLALTFDDGPHPEGTPIVLDALRAANIKATFFVLGSQADLHPDLIRRIDSDGHQIASHTYDHKDLQTLPARTGSTTTLGIFEQLQRTSDSINNIIGKRPAWLRPPYGSINATGVRIAKELGMIVANWNLDTKDWTGNTQIEAGFRQILDRNYANGYVSLQHDINIPSARSVAAVIEFARSQGFTFDTIAGCNGGMPMYVGQSGTPPIVTGGATPSIAPTATATRPAASTATAPATAVSSLVAPTASGVPPRSTPGSAASATPTPTSGSSPRLGRAVWGVEGIPIVFTALVATMWSFVL
ncbi:hypothetical protein HK102_003741 [Quaeritorhiza haematococci]|nr:hypothetical protein HK102_003741 [Quaeritorhiza haematococci]